MWSSQKCRDVYNFLRKPIKLFVCEKYANTSFVLLSVLYQSCLVCRIPIHLMETDKEHQTDV